MANYVDNKVVCTKEVLEKYFIDYDPFGDGRQLKSMTKTGEIVNIDCYITFNKLFKTKKDKEEHGLSIYYGYSFDYKETENGLYEIKFKTKWLYPIKPIIEAIKLCKEDVVWYATEENWIYVSKFYWENNKIVEDILHIENVDSFENWLDDINKEYPDEFPDYVIWSYEPDKKVGWKRWESEDLLNRYYNEYPSVQYYEEMGNK